MLQLLLLAAIAAAGTSVGYFALLPPASGFYARFTMSTAYVGLFFLAAALIIGPLNVLRGVSNPLSTYLRRDIGIIAAILAIAHTIIGLLVHLGDPVQYFFYRTPTGIDGVRFDMFGIANHVGLIATVIMLILLCISNNASMRGLGPEWWKRIQRWNYVAAIAVILHALLYQTMGEQWRSAFIACVFIVAAGVMILQLFGFWRRRERL